MSVELCYKVRTFQIRRVYVTRKMQISNGAYIGKVSRSDFYAHQRSVGKMQAEIVRLTAENAELRARLDKSEYSAKVYELALYHTAISDTEYQEAIERAKKELDKK